MTTKETEVIPVIKYSKQENNAITENAAMLNENILLNSNTELTFEAKAKESLFRYKRDQRKFIKFHDIKYQDQYSSMHVFKFAIDSQQKALYFSNGNKISKYSIENRSWEDLYSLPIDIIHGGAINYNLMTPDGLLHIIGSDPDSNNGRVHIIYDERKKELKSVKLQKFCTDFIYYNKQTNILYVIDHEFDSGSLELLVRFCVMKDFMNETDPAKYKWEERIVKAHEGFEIFDDFFFIACGVFLVRIDLVSGQIFYTNFMRNTGKHNKEIKIEEKLPITFEARDFYAQEWDEEELDNVGCIMTMDNIIHIIDGNNQCIYQIELREIINDDGLYHDKGRFVLLVQGMLKGNQVAVHKDVIELIWKCYTFA